MDQVVVSSKSCPDCSSQMPDTAAFCPGCGRSMIAPERAVGRVGVFSESIAGALAYLSFIPALIFLFREPYRSNYFVRFHSVQCLLCWLIGIVMACMLRLLSVVVFWIPMVGPLLLAVLATVSVLAAFLVWIVLIVKAAQGEMFKLPWVGDYAAQHAQRSPAR
ncbi:MAG TPA: hypothetical protein VMP68_25250 [Candidatus Eisenbacteria bacterium]|nr:hypothetical protein [Candidatus Eisenbacteria bacterium]